MPKGVFLVKSVIPRKKLDPVAWGKALVAELSHEGEIIKRMYQKTVRTWKAPKPVFKIEAKLKIGGPRGGFSKAQQSASVQVFTESQKYNWVDLGTKGPYPIRAKRKPYLIFTVGGSPKTRRRVIGSRKGKAGTDFRKAKEVMHPGIKAREFSDEIRKRRRRNFIKNMREANRKAKRKHGW